MRAISSELVHIESKARRLEPNCALADVRDRSIQGPFSGRYLLKDTEQFGLATRSGPE
jgi:hypothetical protein